MPKLTPEERAAISRANGAKSRGPKTDDGKQRSARNAIKTGEHADKFAHLVPPHCAVLLNEDRQAFYRLFDELIHIYRPCNQEAARIVKQIAIARWQIDRLNTALTMTWNAAINDACLEPTTAAPELADFQAVLLGHLSVFQGNHFPVERINRQIDRLERRIQHLRRSIRDVHTHFPTVAPEPKPAAAATGKDAKRTQSKAQPDVENTEVTTTVIPGFEQIPDPSEPPLYVTEHDEMVLQAYRREFPGRRIVLLPPDDVALGRVSDDDDLPYPPRRVA